MQARKAAPADAALAATVSPSPSPAVEFGPSLGSWMVPPLLVPLLLGLAILAYALLRS